MCLCACTGQTVSQKWLHFSRVEPSHVFPHTFVPSLSTSATTPLAIHFNLSACRQPVTNYLIFQFIKNSPIYQEFTNYFKSFVPIEVHYRSLNSRTVGLICSIICFHQLNRNDVQLHISSSFSYNVRKRIQEDLELLKLFTQYASQKFTTEQELHRPSIVAQSVLLNQSCTR